MKNKLYKQKYFASMIDADVVLIFYKQNKTHRLNELIYLIYKKGNLKPTAHISNTPTHL